MHLIFKHYIKEYVQEHGIQQCQNLIMNFGYQKILKKENVYLEEKLNILEEKEKHNVLIKKKLIKSININLYKIDFLLKHVHVLKMIGNVILDFIEKLKEDHVFLLQINLKKMIHLIY